VTELASIKLKREAFEKWRTGYASALAIIMFVSIYGCRWSPCASSRR
jgi:multiple sugar transport system permease protein